MTWRVLFPRPFGWGKHSGRWGRGNNAYACHVSIHTLNLGSLGSMASSDVASMECRCPSREAPGGVWSEGGRGAGGGGRCGSPALHPGTSRSHTPQKLCTGMG